MSEQIRMEPAGIDWGHTDTGIEVCEHIQLPKAYTERGSCEYTVSLQIYCEVCDQEYSYSIKVN